MSGDKQSHFLIGFSFFVLLAFFSSTLVPSALAQYQSVAPTIPQIQQVSGTYKNSELGLQVTFPVGWNGFEMTNDNGTFLTIGFPQSGSSSTQGGGISFGIFDKSKVASPPYSQPPSQPDKVIECSTPSVNSVTINGMSGSEQTIQCRGDYSAKIKTIEFQTEKYFFWITFAADPTSYDANIATFDTTTNTLQIANTIGAPTIPQSNSSEDLTQNSVSNASVPEFPAPSIGIAVALMMGIILITTRTRLFRNFNESL